MESRNLSLFEFAPDALVELLLEFHEVVGKGHARRAQFIEQLLHLEMNLVKVVRLMIETLGQKIDGGEKFDLIHVASPE